MSVQNQTVKNVYAGNGSTTVFPYTFALNEDDGEYVGVYVTNEEGTSELTTNYTINTTAKTVTYPTTGDPLPADRKITILRELPNEQNLNLENLGPFFANDVEDEMDREVMMIQQLAEQVDRAVKVDMADDLPPASVLYDINHVREYRDAAAGSAAESAMYANNAANSATQSAGSATESANSATEAAGSAAQAAASATQAAQAGAAEATRIVGEVMPQIMIASTNANNYATAAQASATQAALSASTATTQAQIATNAASSAADDADDAADSAGAAAVSAGAAATSATEAATANTEAKYYAKITMDKIAESAVGYPSQSGTLTYDGTEQTPTWDVFYEPQKMTVTGTTAATDAGTYTITMTPKPTYYWWDTDTTTARTQTWTIGRQAISTVPSQSGAVVYDGTEQSPTWADYDSTKLTIGGTTAATEAGTYTATFTPTANYKWSDETTTAKEVTWTISAAEVSVPTVTDTSKTYNGSAQSPTISTYNPALIEVSGDTETDAGSYAVTFHLKSASTTWSDTSTTDKSVAWSIARKSVTVPTVTGGSKTYNGTLQGPTISSYDTDEVVVSGDTSAINAGSYTIYFSLKTANYKWSDETTGVKTSTWSISPKSVAVPTLSNTSKTYNGSAQSPTISSFDATEITQTGDISATNAGNYTVYWALASQTNYIWSDTTTGTKFDTWTIAKAAGSLSISPTTISLNTSTLSDTITVTRTGDGAISAVSSDTSIATVSVSGTTVTVTAVANGNATVTVSVAAGTNYLAPSSKTASVAVQLFPATLNDADWDLISQEAIAGTADTHWDIGDCKEITLNGKVGTIELSNYTTCVYILDFNHTEGTKGNLNGNHIVFGGFKSALTDGIDIALKGYAMNNSFTNGGGWKGCNLRYACLGACSSKGALATQSTITSPVANTFMSCIPSDLRNIIRLRTHYADNNGASFDNSSTVIDACFLLSEKEIFGHRIHMCLKDFGYDTQMAYYANGNSKIKYNHQNASTAIYWFTSSPSFYEDGTFCAVSDYGDDSVDFAANSSAGCVAPGFIV